MNPASVATARCAMVVSSVSPERWEMIVSYPLRAASSIASNVSDSVPDLVRLDQDAVGRARVDPFLEPLDVGDEQVVAADHRPVADPVGQLRERLVVVLVERVLDVREVVLVDEVGDVVDLLVGRLRLLAVDVRLLVVVVQLGGGHIEAEADLEAHVLLDAVDRLVDDLERVRVEIGGPRALVVALRSRHAALVEHVRDCRVDRGVREDGLRDALGAPTGAARNSWM